MSENERQNNDLNLQTSSDIESVVEKWQNGLLDFSLRNPLLNLKLGRRTVTIRHSSPAQLEDKLAVGKTFKLLGGWPSPIQEWNHKPETEEELQVLRDSLDAEFRGKRLYTGEGFDENSLNKRLLSLFRDSQKMSQESGLNTLYLTLGIAEGTEGEGSTQKIYRAPILLIPMKLSRKSVREGFFLERSDEDALINVTLLELLRKNYALEYPVDPNNLPEDDNGIDVPAVFDLFRRELKKLRDWQLKEDEIFLGLFSFQKAIMWSDLKNHREKILQNPIIDHLARRLKENYWDGIAGVDSGDIDLQYPYQEIFTPLSADSSQLCAVLNAEKGKSFVLHGPPGTGKSQTIANMIAHCLYYGKSVLFVAEKRAALDVVYRRLESIGLAPFCLELHSNKSGRQQVLGQFRQAYKFQSSLGTESREDLASRLEGLKKELNGYVKELHRVYPNKKSLFNAISLLSRPQYQKIKEIQGLPSVDLPLLTMPSEGFQDCFTLGEKIQEIAANLPKESWSFFQKIQINSSNNSPQWSQDVFRQAQAIAKLANSIFQSAQKMGKILGIKEEWRKEWKSKDILNVLGQLGEQFARPLRLPEGLYNEDWPRTVPTIKRFIRLGEKCEELLASLRPWVLHQGAVLNESGRREDKKLAIHFSDTFALSRVEDPELPAQIRDLFARFYFSAQAIGQLGQKACRWAKTLGLTEHSLDERQISSLLDLLRLLLQTAPPAAGFLSASWEEDRLKLEKIADHSQKRGTSAANLPGFDLEKTLRFDLDSAKRKYSQIEHSFFLLRPVKKSSFLKTINALRSVSENKITWDQLPQTLEEMEKYISSEKSLREEQAFGERVLGRDWNSAPLDQKAIDEARLWGDKIAQAIREFPDIAGSLQEAFQKTGILWKQIHKDASREKEDIQLLLRDWEENAVHLTPLLRLLADVPLPDPESRGEKTIFERAASLVLKDESNSYASERLSFSVLVQNVCDYLFAYAEYLRLQEELNFSLYLIRHRNAEGFVDWKSFQEAVDRLEKIDQLLERFIRKAIQNQAIQPELYAALRNSLGNALAESQEEKTIQNISLWITDWKRLGELEKLTQNLRGLLEIPNLFERNPARYLDVCVYIAQNLIKHKDALRFWTRWNQLRQKASELGLSDFIDALVQGTIPPDQFSDILQGSLLRSFVDQGVGEVPVLRNFLGEDRDKQILRFKTFDERFRRQTECFLQTELAARMRTTFEAGGDGIALLRHEMEKKKRHIPIRSLLNQMSAQLSAIKPCLLMSPISAAQYLPLGEVQYDLIIFDEASQIPVGDAIGAIARANQLVVVGDPKQLPPTRFFQALSDDGTENEEDYIELESILNECLSAGLPSVYLKWHYRSRHESLITFSNEHYYGNRLYTFPSACQKNEKLGVHFHYVADGVYDRGSSHTNEIEARQVVQAVVKRLQDPVFADKSLGIVTMNTNQQTMIEDFLEIERQNHPEIESFFNSDRVEGDPVFVKSLENVQGDERDVMFFSIGYGPDQYGKIYYNFGPLNRDGGERRLNVAVTRAKEENIIFSSLRAEQLDLTKTKARGVRDLRDYLEYAEKMENGEDYRPRADFASETDYDSPFEAEIAEFLRANGYEIHTQVGCAQYRIDLAIVHPDKPGDYILGIECDGRAYHSSATARDRDLLRQEVLESLGWKICRVWSTSWFYYREEAQKRLLAQVEEAINNCQP